jgi:xanthine dehydrogenase accessory factor
MPTDDVLQVLEPLLEEAAAGRACALCVVVSARGSTPQQAGAMMLVKADGSIAGTVGGGFVEAAVIEAGTAVIDGGSSHVVSHDLGHVRGETEGPICGGTMRVAITAVAPGAVAEYERVAAERVAGRSARLPLGAGDESFAVDVAPRPTLVVVGAGHCGRALADLAATLDFEVVVLDDRPAWVEHAGFGEGARLVIGDPAAALREHDLGEHAYVAIVTRNHEMDYQALRAVLERPCGYIGLIGSKRKRDMIYRDLRADGVDEASLERVHSPIGVEIGARTVREIAVSIAAELIRHRRERPEVTVEVAAGAAETP